MITDEEAKEKGLKIGVEDFSLDVFRVYASCLSGEDLWHLLGDRICLDMSIAQLFHSYVAVSLRDVDFTSWISEASSLLDVLLDEFQAVLESAYTQKNDEGSVELPERISRGLSLDLKASWSTKSDSGMLSQLKAASSLKAISAEPIHPSFNIVTQGFALSEEENGSSFAKEGSQEVVQKSPNVLLGNDKKVREDTQEETLTRREMDDPQFFPYKELKTCPKCNKTFATNRYLRHRHLKTCKGPEAPPKINIPLIRCNKCDKEYRTSWHFNHHISVCGSSSETDSMSWKNKKACLKCGKLFASLEEKQKAQHNCDPPKHFKCPECDYSSYFIRVVEEHYKTRHRRDRCFCCESCGKTFTSRNNLRSHMRIHSERKHTCPECGKKFIYKTKLDLHLTTHFKKEIPCDKCGKVFPNTIYLNRHIQTQHPPNGVLKKFNCPYCPGAFREKKYTKKHIRKKHPGMSTDC